MDKCSNITQLFPLSKACKVFFHHEGSGNGRKLGKEEINSNQKEEREREREKKNVRNN